jgi:predicted Zn finger-like uncharacterized protein
LDFDDRQTLTHAMQITRCPTCATSFQVTPDQLGQADGWVRCGRCEGVFEALLHLTPPASFSDASSLAALFAELDLPLPTPRAKTATLEVAPASAPALIPAPVLRWRGLWLFACVSLLLLLMVQFAWVGRHVLFAQIPALQPALLAACEAFRCEVTWPRSPDAVLIESSHFSEASEGGYSVILYLKNTESYPVATPALELTLLDLQDQVVVRRVFMHDELGLADHLLAQRELRAQLHFDLEADASQRVAGFRALVFYP